MNEKQVESQLYAAYNIKVDEIRIARNKGGRPAKIDSEKSTVKLNCWVTPVEYSRIQARYLQTKAGKKLPFAQFLKQVLLSEKQTKGLKPDELLLTIIINLQERGRQLQVITDLIEERKESDQSKVKTKISEELLKIQTTIEQITTWLYES
ncbi:hypothetical protein [Spirosoma sp.]|uniref:hypothetical protein n=1 Tax=Spirosoma sp. TaxID=1899569 RepID=UPI002624EAC8|nr:hypothetical protein [Spirosoma sp.]MCX6212801.1 hypothetical protein [Spirosoma sp.]